MTVHKARYQGRKEYDLVLTLRLLPNNKRIPKKAVENWVFSPIGSPRLSRSDDQVFLDSAQGAVYATRSEMSLESDGSGRDTTEVRNERNLRLARY